MDSFAAWLHCWRVFKAPAMSLFLRLCRVVLLPFTILLITYISRKIVRRYKTRLGLVNSDGSLKPTVPLENKQGEQQADFPKDVHEGSEIDSTLPSSTEDQQLNNNDHTKQLHHNKNVSVLSYQGGDALPPPSAFNQSGKTSKKKADSKTQKESKLAIVPSQQREMTEEDSVFSRVRRVIIQSDGFNIPTCVDAMCVAVSFQAVGILRSSFQIFSCVPHPTSEFSSVIAMPHLVCNTPEWKTALPLAIIIGLASSVGVLVAMFFLIKKIPPMVKDKPYLADAFRFLLYRYRPTFLFFNLISFGRNFLLVVPHLALASGTTSQMSGFLLIGSIYQSALTIAKPWSDVGTQKIDAAFAVLFLLVCVSGVLNHAAIVADDYRSQTTLNIFAWVVFILLIILTFVSIALPFFALIKSFLIPYHLRNKLDFWLRKTQKFSASNNGSSKSGMRRRKGDEEAIEAPSPNNFNGQLRKESRLQARRNSNQNHPSSLSSYPASSPNENYQVTKELVKRARKRAEIDFFINDLTALSCLPPTLLHGAVRSLPYFERVAAIQGIGALTNQLFNPEAVQAIGDGSLSLSQVTQSLNTHWPHAIDPGPRIHRAEVMQGLVNNIVEDCISKAKGEEAKNKNKYLSVQQMSLVSSHSKKKKDDPDADLDSLDLEMAQSYIQGNNIIISDSRPPLALRNPSFQNREGNPIHFNKNGHNMNNRFGYGLNSAAIQPLPISLPPANEIISDPLEEVILIHHLTNFVHRHHDTLHNSLSSAVAEGICTKAQAAVCAEYFAKGLVSIGYFDPLGLANVLTTLSARSAKSDLAASAENGGLNPAMVAAVEAMRQQKEGEVRLQRERRFGYSEEDDGKRMASSSDSQYVPLDEYQNAQDIEWLKKYQQKKNVRASGHPFGNDNDLVEGNNRVASSFQIDETDLQNVNEGNITSSMISPHNAGGETMRNRNKVLQQQQQQQQQQQYQMIGNVPNENGVEKVHTSPQKNNKSDPRQNSFSEETRRDRREVRRSSVERDRERNRNRERERVSSSSRRDRSRSHNHQPNSPHSSSSEVEDRRRSRSRSNQQSERRRSARRDEENSPPPSRRR